MEIDDLLQAVVNNRASDLHLSAGLPPMQRLHGEMSPLGNSILAADEISKLLAKVMTEAQTAQLLQTLECDFSFTS